MSESVFNDLMESLNEVEEHQCGNIILRTEVRTDGKQEITLDTIYDTML